MNDMHDQDVTRWLGQLGELKPTPEATRRALDRTRHALVAAPVLAVAAKSKISTATIGVTGSILLVAVGLTGWLLLTPGDGSKSGLLMNAPASVCYRQTTRAAGESDVTVQLLIRADGVWRAEKKDGSYTIFDAANHQALYVNVPKREATLRRDVTGPQFTMYDAIKNMANDPSARPLPPRQIDGQDVLGYVANAQGQTVTIWVDSQTLLPVRVECDWKGADGKLSNIILDQFEFTKELDNSLFSTEPPAGYKVNGAAMAPPGPSDNKVVDLILTPLVGVGLVKFGMSEADVESALGKADTRGQTEDGQLALSYNAKGLSLTLKDKSAVSAIVFRSAAKGSGDSGVKTDKGITFGSSAADITAAYGPADSSATKDSVTLMTYNQLQMTFSLAQDKLVEIKINAK